MKTRTRWLLIFVFVACQVLAFFLMFPNPAYADDCLSDPLNAADCMRTPGARQIDSVLISLAGTAAATLVSIVGSSAAAESAAVEGAVEGAVVSGAAGMPHVYTPDEISDIQVAQALSDAAQAAVAWANRPAPPPPPVPEPPAPQLPVDVAPPPSEPVSGVESQTPQLPAEPPAPEPEPAPADSLPGVLQGAVSPVIGLPNIGLPDMIKDLLGGLTSNDIPEGLKDLINEAAKARQEAADYIDKNLPGFVDSGPFDMLKNAVGSGSAIAGALSEFVNFVDSPATIQSIHDALRAWQNNPTSEAAEEYLKQLGKTTDSRLGKLAPWLDAGAKGLDMVEAVGKGIAEANKEGFTGIDQQLIIWSELGKKDLTWMLTKNPIVGTIDWATGTTTQAIWGKEGRVDIGGIIDKAGDKWKDIVKEYGSNTGGAPEADAANQTADQFLSSIRRIKDQVKSGQISREEGSDRAHKLQQILMGGAQ